MKNTRTSSNRLYTDRPLDSQPAASLFQIARAEMEPSPRFRWEAAAQAVFGLCAAVALWVNVGATVTLHQSGGMERFAAEALRSRSAVTLEQTPVAANTPAPIQKSAPAYL